MIAESHDPPPPKKKRRKKIICVINIFQLSDRISKVLERSLWVLFSKSTDLFPLQLSFEAISSPGHLNAPRGLRFLSEIQQSRAQIRYICDHDLKERKSALIAPVNGLTSKA